MIERLRDVLANDAALVGWCVATYGRAPLVMIGFDDEVPADPETDYPALVLEPLSSSSGNVAPRETRSVMLAVGVRQEAVEDAAVEVQTPAGPMIVRTRTRRGAMEAERLRELALAAVFASRGLGKIDADGEAQDLSMHPFYLSFCALRIERTRQR